MEQETVNEHLKQIEKYYDEYFLAKVKSTKSDNKAAVKKKGLKEMDFIKKRFKYYLETNEELLLLAVDSDKMDQHAIFAWDDYFKNDLQQSLIDLIDKLRKKVN